MGITDIDVLYSENQTHQEGLMADKNYDEEDVKEALSRTDTSDGPGFDEEDELPESDFVSFAEDDVEEDDAQ